MVEWGGLENRCGGNATEGSNPSLSVVSSLYEKSLYPEGKWFFVTFREETTGLVRLRPSQSL